MDELKNKIVKQFDIARKEGMLKSKDGEHSEFSDSDAEDVIESFQEAGYRKVTGQPKLLSDDEICKNSGCAIGNKIINEPCQYSNRNACCLFRPAKLSAEAQLKSDIEHYEGKG